MLAIPLEKVKRDNSNIRGYSDKLWRELRKTRFKPANPDPIHNQMYAETLVVRPELHVEFRHDIENFMNEKLSPREATIFRMFLFSGGMTQTEMAERLGVCQATIAQSLQVILKVVKEDFYGCK